MRTMTVALAVSIALALLACDQRHVAGAAPSQSESASTAGRMIEPARAPLPTLAPILSKVSPAVVSISVQGTAQVEQSPLFQDPFFRRFFGLPENGGPRSMPTQRFRAVGSGVIFDAEHGYLLTNNHVVERADNIRVTLKDRRQLNAKLVATDPKTDIAVLKIAADRLTSLPIGRSKDLQVGDYVVAIGNPFGVGQAATFGIISALGRTGLGIESYEDFIQTDASINPGNSGGALVDMSGRLIGINTAILSRSGGNVGVGFAIPIDLAKSVAQQLIAHGKISRGALGIVIQDLTPGIAQAMGVNLSHGAVVSQVLPKSAAAKADVKEGDIVTALDGQPVADSGQLRNAVGQMPPGTAVRLTLSRDGREMNVSVTLEPQTESASASSAMSAQGGSEPPLSGMTVGPVPEDDEHFGKLKGVYVMNVAAGSAADEAGLQQGDIIVSAGNLPVGRPSELAQILRGKPKEKPLLLRVVRGQASFFLTID